MHNISVFTWNMQRGSSISPGVHADKPKAAERRKLLDTLCSTYDIGFITEPGNDLINAVSTSNATTLLLPNGPGFWNCSLLSDGQQGTHDCKNLVFSKRILSPVDFDFQSGSDDAYRYPAAGVWLVNADLRVLLVTLHATSGGGGHDNSNALFDYLDTTANKTKHGNCQVAIAGGDMNCNHRHFIMPQTPSHQSGSTLDGFMYECYDEDAAVDISAPVVYFGGGSYELETTIDKGYYAVNGTTRVRLSDHAPVTTNVSINLVPRFGYSIGNSTRSGRNVKRKRSFHEAATDSDIEMGY